MKKIKKTHRRLFLCTLAILPVLIAVAVTPVAFAGMDNEAEAVFYVQ